MNFLITGGAGFIGSAVVRFLIEKTNHKVFNLDKLTYAGNIKNLSNISTNSRYKFIHGDICDRNLVTKSLLEIKPNIVMHLAAESHVDRSIDGPMDFIQTNIVGTTVLLECANEFKKTISKDHKFIFHHISTDEVYGSLDNKGLFNELTSYNPNSPYSASKASSDHLVRAWYKTYGLPIIITNCSNNYGPYQFPEKLIPLTILNALEGKSVPLYGDGMNIRDWLYVEDHVNALYKVIMEGNIGDTYNIGGNNEKTNLEVVEMICNVLDELRPNHSYNFKSHKNLITFVQDRPGHDLRYAIDATKIKNNLKWKPAESFQSGIRKTIEWYIKNNIWCKQVQKEINQRERLGNLKNLSESVSK